ncbi:MAG: hypothetical protein V3S28_08820 [Acidimicrobiia bacterium]
MTRRGSKWQPQRLASIFDSNATAATSLGEDADVVGVRMEAPELGQARAAKSA